MGKKKKAKHKLPKKIAGVKIPKSLRKRGGGLVALAASPIGRAIIADVLVLMAERISGAKRTKRAVSHAGQEVADAGSHAGSAMLDVAESAVDVVRSVRSGKKSRGAEKHSKH